MADFARSADPARPGAARSAGDAVAGRRPTRPRADHAPARPARPSAGRLPPVFHVAGTNGKGSTCAFLRAALEAAGLKVHAYTSPHLVRFNERIRIAGQLIDDDAARRPAGRGARRERRRSSRASSRSTTAAAFLAFARTPADACIVEVGLGGRLDATNVDRPAAGLRHRQPRPRPSGISSATDGRHRRREGRHRQARRAARHPALSRRRSRRQIGEVAHAGARRGCRAAGGWDALDSAKTGCTIATRGASSICPLRACRAGTRR